MRRRLIKWFLAFNNDDEMRWSHAVTLLVASLAGFTWWGLHAGRSLRTSVWMTLRFFGGFALFMAALIVIGIVGEWVRRRIWVQRTSKLSRLVKSGAIEAPDVREGPIIWSPRPWTAELLVSVVWAAAWMWAGAILVAAVSWCLQRNGAVDWLLGLLMWAWVSYWLALLAGWVFLGLGLNDALDWLIDELLLIMKRARGRFCLSRQEMLPAVRSQRRQAMRNRSRGHIWAAALALVVGGVGAATGIARWPEGPLASRREAIKLTNAACTDPNGVIDTWINGTHECQCVAGDKWTQVQCPEILTEAEVKQLVDRMAALYIREVREARVQCADPRPPSALALASHPYLVEQCLRTEHLGECAPLWCLSLVGPPTLVRPPESRANVATRRSEVDAAAALSKGR
jgi:hypothetical protein